MPQSDDKVMSNHEEFDSKITELRSRFLSSLPQKLVKMELAWTRICTINWNQELLQRLHLLTGQIVTSSNTFGLDPLSIEARELESLFASLQKKSLPPGSTEKSRISKKLASLNAIADQNNDQAAELVNTGVQGEDGSQQRLVYLVDADSSYVDSLAGKLERWGYKIRTFTTLNSFYLTLDKQLPDVVCLDTVFPEGNLAGITAVENVKKAADKKVNIIFISSRNDMVARLKALRVGNDGYLTKPVEDHVIRDTLAGILAREDTKKVLVIDNEDDAETSAGLLKQAGYHAEWITNPVETLAKFEQFLPDLIITDYHLPHCNGIELAMLLRQDERYKHIPILFISKEKDKYIQQTAATVSGNEFLRKPVPDKTLLTSVAEILAKSGTFKPSSKSADNRQNATNLADRNFLYSELETAIATATETEVTRHVLTISVDKMDYLKSRFGLQAFARLEDRIRYFLSKQVGANLFVQMKDDLYVVLTRPLSFQQASDFADHLCRVCSETPFHVANSEISLTLSIGVTAVDHRVGDLEQCLSYSEEGCVIANQSGGNCSAYWPEPEQGNVIPTPLEALIVKAIENKTFKMMFQPVVNLVQTEKLYECRVRLLDPGGNELLPNQFLPYIEKLQLQFELDRWVIQNAIETLTSTRGMGQEEMNLFVKVMPEQYKFEDIINLITGLKGSSGLKGRRRLYLQIDEKWAIAHQDSLRKDIPRLNSLGVGFLLDNTGESDYGIDLVEGIAPNLIKLDMKLIKEFMVNEEVKNKLQQILSAASKTDIGVIAGAVEDAKVFATLWAMGIRYFQGYFIQQPEHSLNFDFKGFNYG